MPIRVTVGVELRFASRPWYRCSRCTQVTLRRGLSDGLLMRRATCTPLGAVQTVRRQGGDDPNPWMGRTTHPGARMAVPSIGQKPNGLFERLAIAEHSLRPAQGP